MPRRPMPPVLAVLTLAASAPALGQTFALPDGPGKARVSEVCGGCHAINRLGAGYTPDGWRMVAHMMQNFGAPVPAEEWPTVTNYLIAAFPEKPRPPAVVLAGPVQASIKEWPVATVGSRPHDPMAAPDGAIWYSGQLANVLGRLDPATGKIKEYKLEAQTGPHGLVEDKAGNVWFTANFMGAIGKLDPRTGAVATYPLPADPAMAARDPHSLAFDQSGILWFTAQQANRIGRLDPQTGEIKLLTPPTQGARPYGIQVNAKGVPFIVEFGANKVLSIDPQTLAMREYVLPDAAARPRRLAIGPDDVVWYTDFARGYLGRLDPVSGQVREWLSPSGPRSEPYGIVFTKGALWYSESFAKPCTVVRFDPQAEKFQSWAIPGGGDIVRNMDVTRDGNPIMANSLANQIGLVEIK